jgi:hypothetical protein
MSWLSGLLPGAQKILRVVDSLLIGSVAGTTGKCVAIVIGIPRGIRGNAGKSGRIGTIVKVNAFLPSSQSV